MKRPAAVFGFTALITVTAVILFSEAAAYVIFAAAGILCAVFGFLRRSRLFKTFLTICIAVCVSFLSYKASYCLKYKPDTKFDGLTCTLTGTAADFPHTSGDYTALKLENCSANGTELNGGVIFYGKELPDIRPGDTVTVKKATLSCADEADTFFMHALSKNEYFSVFGGSVSSENGNRSGLVYGILSLRHTISNRLRLSLSSDAYPVADALITGNQTSFTSGFSRQLRVAGASHIFAVSGMHLSVWTLVLFSLFGAIFGSRRITGIFGIVFVLFFIVFTGKSPSVVRAGIMLVTVFAGSLLRKPPDALNSLGLASAICIIANPFLAGNVSFLLSTSATAAVIVSVNLSVSDKLRINILIFKNIVTAIADTLIASAVVTVFTIPVSAFFFGSTSLLSGISSLLCTLPAEGIMISGALGTALFGANSLCGLSFYICEKLCGLISALIQKLSDLDFFLLPLNAEATAVLCAVMCAAACAAAFFASKKKTAVVSAVSLCLSAALTVTLISHAFLTPQTSVFIAGGKNGDILISENHGKSTVVLGMSGGYSASTAIKSKMMTDGRINADLLILPKGIRNRQKLVSAYAPREILYADGSSTLCSTDSAVRNAEFALSASTTLKYTNTDGFLGCLLKTADKSVAFIFSGKKHALPDEYLNADIAVFRYGIPENAENMQAKKILLSTYTDGNGIIMSADTNGIKITAWGGN